MSLRRAKRRPPPAFILSPAELAELEASQAYASTSSVSLPIARADIEATLRLIAAPAKRTPGPGPGTTSPPTLGITHRKETTTMLTTTPRGTIRQRIAALESRATSPSIRQELAALRRELDSTPTRHGGLTYASPQAVDLDRAMGFGSGPGGIYCDGNRQVISAVRPKGGAL